MIRAQNAYLCPDVEEVKEKRFRFSVPDLGALRQFADRKMNWTAEKVDEHILPVIKLSEENRVKRGNIKFYLDAKK